jgi:hypothetical protein
MSDEDEIFRRVQKELRKLDDDRIERLATSEHSLRKWLYKVANKIARIIRAPFEWIAALIEGFVDGLLGR